MKKLFICSGLGMMFFMLAGCTTNYVMTTKNGQTIVTQGKPQLDKETGMTSYTDQEGNQREINSNDVAQLIKVSIGRDAVLAATRIKPGRPGAAGEGECYVAASSFNTTLSVESAVTGAVRWISATRRRTPNQPATSRMAISGNEAIV